MSSHLDYVFRVQGKLTTPSFGELLLARRLPREIRDEDQSAVPTPLSSSIIRLNEPANELVAVKRYSQQDEATLFGVAENELAVVQRLRELGRHPHVVQYFGAELSHHGKAVDGDWQVQLVMEFCERGDLFAMLSNEPGMRVHEAQALDIIAQVGSGLAFLHAHGVSHGNISLENVLIDARGQCKLADFRLSHANMHVTAPIHPVSAVILANVDYLAPERSTDPSGAVDDLYDPVAQDIYALGVLLFVMTTGLPLVGRGAGRLLAFEAMRALGCAGALRVWSLDHLLTADTTSLLGKLIAVDPTKRFKSIEEALNHPSLAHRVRIG